MSVTRTILLADDESSLRRSISFVLRKSGFNVIECVNGVEAIMGAKNNQIDIAIMDLKMRNINGLTAIDTIQSFNPTLPIIVITAYADQVTLNKFPPAVIKYYIKPFEVAHIIEFINSYFAHVKK